MAAPVNDLPVKVREAAAEQSLGDHARTFVGSWKQLVLWTLATVLGIPAISFGFLWLTSGVTWMRNGDVIDIRWYLFLVAGAPLVICVANLVGAVRERRHAVHVFTGGIAYDADWTTPTRVLVARWDEIESVWPVDLRPFNWRFGPVTDRRYVISLVNERRYDVHNELGHGREFVALMRARLPQSY